MPKSIMIVHSLEYYAAVKKDVAAPYRLWTDLLNKIQSNAQITPVQVRMKAVSACTNLCACFEYFFVCVHRSMHKCAKYDLIAALASGEQLEDMALYWGGHFICLVTFFLCVCVCYLCDVI